MKYYAVKIGKTPGIYTSWDDAKKQVEGFKGAMYKSFKTEDEAKKYMEIENNKIDDIDIKQLKTFAFVDGSFNKEKMIYGSGYFLYHKSDNGTGYEYKESSFSGNNKELLKIRNVAGEIQAAKAVIQEALLDRKYDELYIFFDYQGIQSWADGTWSCNELPTLEYSQFIQSLDCKDKIHFVKVKSHSNHAMNDYVDFLAKKACSMDINEEKFKSTWKELCEELNMEG